MNSDFNSDFYDPDCLGTMLYIFHKNHKKYLDYELSKFDLNLVQALCILKIYDDEGLSQKDLSEGFSLTKGAITKAVIKLENRGILTREKHIDDKRQHVLKLTENGKELVPILNEIGNDWKNQIGVNDLSPEFLETFKGLVLKSISLNEHH